MKAADSLTDPYGALLPALCELIAYPLGVLGIDVVYHL